ncbi:MAG: GtrA family protein [Prevotella sp.]|nr:GtrA family protein [Prevotella sp.]
MKENLKEVVRFGIVGILATLIQVAVYNLLVGHLNYAIANTIGYIVSFIFNYVASTRYTFRVKSTAKRGAGFALSHAVNYLLQTLLLAFFVWLGLGKRLAQLPMFCICVPVNFLLVRYFLKKK